MVSLPRKDILRVLVAIDFIHKSTSSRSLQNALVLSAIVDLNIPEHSEEMR